MFSKISSSLRKLFHPVLRLFRMSSLPSAEAEFPENVTVSDWMSTLQKLYCSRDPDVSHRDRSRMKTLKVVSIRRYKVKKGPEHEYLVAKVSSPDLDQTRFLCIERDVKIEVPTNDTAERTPRNSPFSSQASLSSLPISPSLVVLKKLPAHDHVTQLTDWPTNDKCTDNFDCEDSEMILLDLAMAAKLVHDHSSKYQLITRQCFWYSDAMLGVLEKHFPGIKIVKKTKQEDLIETYGSGSSGTRMHVPVYFRRMSLINEIHDTFVQYKLDFQSLVNLLNIGIFLLTNYCHRFWKPNVLLKKHNLR